MDLEDVLVRYLDDVRPTSSVMAALHTSWPKFSAFCSGLGLTRLQDVAPCHLEDFHNTLLWEPGPHGHLYRPNSVDQILRRVRQVVRWAHRRGHIPHDPSQGLLLPRPLQPTRGVLRWEEVQAVLNAPDQTRPRGLRDAALFALVAETDLGLLQCLALVVGQERLLEMEDPTRDLVAAYLQLGRPAYVKDAREKSLFLAYHGGPMGRQAAYLRLLRAGQAVGLEAVTAAVLRRSYKAHFERQAQRRHSSF